MTLPIGTRVIDSASEQVGTVVGHTEGVRGCPENIVESDQPETFWRSDDELISLPADMEESSDGC